LRRNFLEGNSKAVTFIGFSVRARKIVCGVNALSYTREKIKLVILCSVTGEGTYKEGIKLSKKFNCPLIICNNIKLEDIVKKDNCKLAGIFDNNLAKAVLDNLDGNFLIYSGGDNL
jgi:ribosomal protein L7Ae-like RNA K-turn-binding protein